MQLQNTSSAYGWTRVGTAINLRQKKRRVEVEQLKMIFPYSVHLTPKLLGVLKRQVVALKYIMEGRMRP